MKRLWKLFVLVAATLMGFNISSGEQYWITSYGGVGEDSISIVRQTSDGGYIVGGSTSSYELNGMDILVMKLDSGGNVTWQKTYGTKEYTIFSSIQETVDGGYILAGNQDDITPYFQYGNAWIVKLTASGDIVWQKSYGENGYLLYAIEQTDDGGFIAAGEYANAQVDQGIWVLKLNSGGDILWQKGFDGRIMGKSIQQTSDGGFIVLGRSTYVYSHIIVIKLEITGDVAWKKTYEYMCDFSNFDVYPSSIVQTAEGGYILAYYCGGNKTGLLKLDGGGEFAWANQYTGDSAKFSTIQHTPDGGYIVAGRLDQDALVAKLDGSGTITWQKKYGGSSGEDYANSIQQTIDGGYIVGGTTSSFGMGGNDGWVLKLDDKGTIPGCDIITNGSMVYSNPVLPWSVGSCCGISEVGPDVAAYTQTTPQDSSITEHGICSYSIPDDRDGDGIVNYEDNCPWIPNGPDLGVCCGLYCGGNTCHSDDECSFGGLCNMNQGNIINCGCKASFDCDVDVDGSDAARFKSFFGRNLYQYPCTNEDSCDGDFDCDADVDGSDAAEFKRYYGTAPLPPYNVCVTCVDGVYLYDCSY